MTELRFIERCVLRPEYGENIGQTKRVLQYRQQFLDVSQGYYWSEWTDVPLVKEGDD